MERRLIRKRFQITIPREIRRFLCLYVGQALSFRLGESGEIVITTGSPPHKEDLAAFQELGAKKTKKKGRWPCGKKIRKSDRMKDARLEKLLSDPRELIVTELQETVRLLSGYLQELQERLVKSGPGS